jgi:arylformamidase
MVRAVTTNGHLAAIERALAANRWSRLTPPDTVSNTRRDEPTMTLIEISHTIRHGMATYPGLPRPVISLHTSHHDSTDGVASGFAIGRLDMVGNTGTYLDSPYHRFSDRPDVSRIGLRRLVDLPVTLVDVRSAVLDRAVRVELAPADIAGRAVLFHTGWDTRWGSDRYWEPGPYLAADMLDVLIIGRPALVGVDFWNVDDTTASDRPAHTRLLGADIPIVEHLCHLGDVPDQARAFVVPLAVEGAPSTPVRAFVTA